MSGAVRVLRGVVLAAFAAFFLVPLAALADFSTKVPGGGRTASAWHALVSDPALTAAVRTSVELALLSALGVLVLLVPTMVWVRLRVPRARRLVELLCLLPLTVPALVLVVGLGGVYAWVDYLLGDSPLTLALVYVVLVLPFAHRALDASLSAIDVRTLAEAARSLGAGWTTVVWRVVLPNIRTGVASAAFVTVALVLGEYTVASLLHYDTLPVAIVLLGKADAAESMAAALASLLAAGLLLVLLSFLDRRRRAPRRWSR